MKGIPTFEFYGEFYRPYYVGLKKYDVTEVFPTLITTLNVGIDLSTHV